MIEIKHLSKRYHGNKTDTLHDISLSLPEKGLVFLIGKSGSGKSTFLHLLGGMDLEYEGSLKVNGKEMKSMTEAELDEHRFKTVSFVFQSFRAEEEENVMDNLLQPLAITALTEEEKRIKIRTVLSKVGLSEKQKQVFHSLSGGEKKRISLAKGLLQETPILLADEPLASLNKRMREEITSLLIQESNERLVIVITHETEEIPELASIYQLTEGGLTEVRTSFSDEKAKSCPYQRKKYRGFPFLHQLKATLLSRRAFFLITLITFATALFSISFGFQLSGGVSSSLKQSLSAYMSDNSLVISKKNKGFTATGFETSDYQELNYLSHQYPDTILCQSSFYLDSLNDIFTSNQEFTIELHNSSFHLNEISLDSFLAYRMPKEVPDSRFYGLSDNTEEEEVILGLHEEGILNLYYLLFGDKLTYVEEESLKKIGDALWHQPVQLTMNISKIDWSYHLEHAFSLRGIVPSKTCFIVNSCSDFNVHFVKEILHFKEKLPEEESPESVPWILRKCEGFRLYPDGVSLFLKQFLKDRTASDYVPQVIQDPQYYDPEDPRTHNHIAIYHDYLPKVSVYEIQRHLEPIRSDIASIAYSSPVYTYTASGYISGFQKPFFFSKRKEKLNQIQDSAATTHRDLGAFQASLIQVPEDVIKADLSSSMNPDGLRFVSLDGSSPTIRYGKAPVSDGEIGISSALAEKLYDTMTLALKAPLYTLTLDQTKKKEDLYVNHFSEGQLKVSAIYDDKRLAIYQDSLFPLAYAFSTTSLSPQETRIQQAVVKVNLSDHTPEYYLNHLKKLPEYEGEFPMLEMTKEISKIMKRLSALFLSFALLSLVSSVFLLSLSLYLIIEKDKKQIGILLSQGYTRKDIAFFYFVFSEALGLLSYLLSFVISLLAEQVLKKTLENLLSSYVLSVFPFLLSFATALIVSGAVGLVFLHKLKDISPLDAFRRSF